MKPPILLLLKIRLAVSLALAGCLSYPQTNNIPRHNRHVLTASLDLLLRRRLGNTSYRPQGLLDDSCCVVVNGLPILVVCVGIRKHEQRAWGFL
ncbi:hypothetical protein V8F06_005515 [Rhypophila decipiens]